MKPNIKCFFRKYIQVAAEKVFTFFALFYENFTLLGQGDCCTSNLVVQHWKIMAASEKPRHTCPWDVYLGFIKVNKAELQYHTQPVVRCGASFGRWQTWFSNLGIPFLTMEPKSLPAAEILYSCAVADPCVMAAC